MVKMFRVVNDQQLCMPQRDAKALRMIIDVWHGSKHGCRRSSVQRAEPAETVGAFCKAHVIF